MSDAIERWMSDYRLEADTEGRVDQKMGSDDFDPPRGIYLFHIEAIEKQVRADERKLAREAMFKELCAATCFGCEDEIEILRENGKWMHADGDECAASIIRDAKESAK